jgi:hypothetical protein
MAKFIEGEVVRSKTDCPNKIVIKRICFRFPGFPQKYETVEWMNHQQQYNNGISYEAELVKIKNP